MNLIQTFLHNLINNSEVLYPRKGLVVFAEELIVEPDENVKDKLKLREDRDYCIIGYIVGDKVVDVFTGEKHTYMFGRLYVNKRIFSQVKIQKKTRGIYCDDIDEYICQPDYRNVANRPLIIIYERTFYNKKLARFLKAKDDTLFTLSELKEFKDRLNLSAERYLKSLININE